MSKPPATVQVVAGVLVRRNGKYLLVQENKGKAAGLWNWPAGKVDEGDTIEKTAVKEAKEESGYRVALTRKRVVFHKNMRVPVQHLFVAAITGGHVAATPNKDIRDVQWLTLAQLKTLNRQGKLRGHWVLEGINALN